jgi:hypothetical protein
MAEEFDSESAAGPLLTLIYYAFQVSHEVSLSRLRRVRPFDRCTDAVFFGSYVLAWAAALSLLLAFAPLSGVGGVIVASIALYRLQDLLFGTIGDAFEFYVAGGRWQSKVVLAIVNIGQVVTIFAIAFAVFTHPAAFSPTAPHGRFGHFFLSWSTLPPLGSGFAAQTTRARAMVISESAVGTILTVIAVSRFLSKTDPTPPPSPETDDPGRDGRTGL